MKSADYWNGWYAGYVRAQKVSMENRDHFRRLLEGIVPFETHDEAIARIYDKARPATDYPTVDGVDLYVVLPPQRGELHVHENGEVAIFRDGKYAESRPT